MTSPALPGGESSLMSFAGHETAGTFAPLIFDATLAFSHAATRRAHEYWDARRRTRTMPARTDLDHAGMRKFIAHVGLVGCVPDGNGCDYQIRVAGSEWESVFGGMTGRSLNQFLSHEIEARWRQAFDRVRFEKSPFRISTRIGFQGKNWLEAEMFVAPLGEDAQTVSMIFLCFAATNTARRTPGWALLS